MKYEDANLNNVETTISEDVENLYGKCVRLIDREIIDCSEYDSWVSFMKSNSKSYNDYVDLMSLMDDAKQLAMKEASAIDEILAYVREQKAKKPTK